MTELQYAPSLPPAPDPKLQPHSESAEQAVLGSILMYGDGLEEVSSFLKEDHFFFLSNRWIYAAMLKLNSEGHYIDSLTVADTLKGRQQLDQVGGEAYLTMLATNTPTYIHLETYARIVERGYWRRALLSLASKIAAAALDEEHPVPEIMARVQTAAMSLTAGQTQDTLRPIASYLPDVIERIDGMASGQISSGMDKLGFAAVDNVLQGIDEGTMTIIAARPGGGKTAMLLQIILNRLLMGKKIAYFSIEMTIKQTMNRLLGMAAGLNNRLLRNGGMDADQYNKLINAITNLEDQQLYIDPSATLSVSNIRTQMLKMELAGVEIDDVFVDYMLLMKDDHNGKNKVEATQNVSRDLTKFARETGKRLIVATQLNRAVESRADPCPQLSDLKESGQIEQDASGIVFLYKDREDTTSTRPSSEYVKLNVFVAKNRVDSTGKVALQWHLPTQIIRDLPVRSVSGGAVPAEARQRI